MYIYTVKYSSRNMSKHTWTRRRWEVNRSKRSIEHRSTQLQFTTLLCIMYAGAAAQYSNVLSPWLTTVLTWLQPGCQQSPPHNRQLLIWTHSNVLVVDCTEIPLWLFRPAAEGERGQKLRKKTFKGIFHSKIKGLPTWNGRNLTWVIISHHLLHSCCYNPLLECYQTGWIVMGKNAHMFLKRESCWLLLMHIKQNRWCYTLNSNTNQTSMKYPFQSSGASP